MNRIKIDNKSVGKDDPVYIVAEAGSNHNGNLEQALRLIDVATEAGADAVKFQNFKAARMYPKSAGESDYLKVNKSIYSIIEQMEMPDAWLPQLSGYCSEKGIEFISSPFDEESADLLAPYLNVFKIASYEMTHTPLLRHIARLNKPLIVSTGTATLDEVMKAVKVIVEEGNEQIILLQCTASYPTPPEAINARALVALREATGCLVGLSDHSRDPVIAPIVATALGACLIEKHFTLSNRLPGPDHEFALEPDELRRLVVSVRAAERVLGHGRKEVLPEERELHAFARRSIFAKHAIKAGEILGPDNIAVLRCGKLGYGLPPDQYENLIGRAAVRDISAESLIQHSDLK